MSGVSIEMDDLQSGDLVTRTNVSLGELKECIKKLDGQRHSIMTLRILGAECYGHMCIGGGPDLYIVYYTMNNLSFHQLVSSTDKGDDFITLFIGDESYYPVNHCVGFEKAWKAIVYYFTNQCIDGNSLWMEC
ncbi:hypothetical protein SAMN02745181_2376 [Rubritalea squalenifaciens DSM 18772]|uniref:Immunity protein Imm1 n=1 Tax=Rubritalea squalenifaciens DSM 18772 TaxID=1123071 RepID=A0A1M6LER9_9BACT|nr:hypothetical protein SAMN02745181_2376 [Rubritalea squalenifaciens DSM 18772]